MRTRMARVPSSGVARRDGREWTAPFAGYGELTLLLRSPDRSECLRVPFESATEIRRPNGDQIKPRALAKAFRAGKLPSAEALTVEARAPLERAADPYRGAVQVAVEDIESATAELPPGVNVAGVILISIIATVAVF